MGKKIIIGIIVCFLLIQFIPAHKSNPDITADIKAPDEIKEIIVNSCYDCHSNMTVWPCYSYVAPVSWLVTNHVDEGREHTNFSQWYDYSDKRRAHLYHEIAEEVEKGKMPLREYQIFHPEIELSETQSKKLIEWSNQKHDSIMSDLTIP